MSASRGMMLALGLALAAPVAAYAYDGASATIRHHHMLVIHRSVVHRSVQVTALASAPAAAPVLGFWSPTYIPAPEEHETDGLSRNPNDCITYGCVDNN
jgi:hypothetical protein